MILATTALRKNTKMGAKQLTEKNKLLFILLLVLQLGHIFLQPLLINMTIH